MKIGIRADGGLGIGMGHIVRCVTLAKELRKRNDVFFICKVNKNTPNKYLPGINFILKNNFKIKEIDEVELEKEIIKIEADCIITDSYDVDEKYFNLLKDNFNFSGCFDDEKICEYFNVDFIINQNFYGKYIKYNINNNTRMLLGSDYIILRDEFRNTKEERIVNKEIKNIMITVGGSDYDNNTEKLIKQFWRENYILHVVIGSGFENIDKLKKYECDKVKLYFNVSMKDLMQLSDICISSCGTTIYELIALGIPFIGVKVVENQEMLFDYIYEYSLGEVSEIEDVYNKIKNLTYERRLELSKKLPNIIDGSGVERITNVINNLIDVC